MISKTVECSLEQIIEFVRERLGFNFYCTSNNGFIPERDYFWEQVSQIYICRVPFSENVDYADLSLHINTDCIRSWDIYLNDIDRTSYSIMESKDGVFTLEICDFSDVG